MQVTTEFVGQRFRIGNPSDVPQAVRLDRNARRDAALLHSLPAAQKILVLAPHPDDETLGCGGTLRLLASAGREIDVAYITRGELGFPAGQPLPNGEACDALAGRRSQEAQAACQWLGVRRIYFLEGSDRRVELQPQLSDAILNLLDQEEYGCVFCPWPRDCHKDHVATFQWFRRAVERWRHKLEAWLYEVWFPLHPNRVVCIDAVIGEKLKAIEVYQSQLRCYNYLGGFEALARYRSLFVPRGRYAEAFFTADEHSLPN